MAGYSEQDIEKLGDLSQKSAEEIQELVRKKSMEALGLNGSTQKVVPLMEVRKWITDGWEYVSSLPGNEAIIRLPAH